MAGDVEGGRCKKFLNLKYFANYNKEETEKVDQSKEKTMNVNMLKLKAM